MLSGSILILLLKIETTKDFPTFFVGSLITGFSESFFFFLKKRRENT